MLDGALEHLSYQFWLKASKFRAFGRSLEGGYLNKLGLHGSEVRMSLSRFTAFGEVSLPVPGPSVNLKLKFWQCFV